MAAMELLACETGWGWLEHRIQVLIAQKISRVKSGRMDPEEYKKECHEITALELVIATPRAAVDRYLNRR